MKVFVSSVISGMEELRDSADSGARTLGHSVLRAEALNASPATPQRACLDLVRQADVVVLLLGRRYGDRQLSGLSPTHEEFREARDRCQVLCFLQTGVERDSPQTSLVSEVQAWASGHFTQDFSDKDDLSRKVTASLHQLELAAATVPIDADEITARARELVDARVRSSRVLLSLGVALGPKQTLLRPVQLGDMELRRFLKHEALTGDFAVLSTESGTRDRTSGGRIICERDHGAVEIDELGSVFVRAPISNEQGVRLAVIEEDLVDQLETMLAFSGRVLEYLDSPHRLSHFVAAARLVGADYFGWQTRTEHARSPNSVVAGFGEPATSVVLRPPHRPRAALAIQRRELAEDLVAVVKRARQREF